MPRSSVFFLLLAPWFLGGWTYCGYWAGDNILNVCVPEVLGSCEGLWTDEFENTGGGWNGVLASPVFAKWEEPVYFVAPDDGLNEVSAALHADVEATYGPFSLSAVAVTFYWFDIECGLRLENDVIFMADYTWTTDRLSSWFGGPYYYQEVAAHELGHVATLDHEDGVLTVMNPTVHIAPSMYRYPHTDEIGAFIDHPEFDTVARDDHALLPYGEFFLGTVSPTLTPSVVEAGDLLFVDNIRTENWGTGGLDDVYVTWVLSWNDVGSDLDDELATTYWQDLGIGYLSGPVPLIVPLIEEDVYYVIGVIDIEGVVDDYYTFQDQVVMGTVFVQCRDQDGDGEPDEACGGADCADGDPTVAPGAPETCDGVDQNCNETVDEGVQEWWFVDQDEDGYGAVGSGVFGCRTDTYTTTQAGDCDDTTGSVHPGRDDSCGNGDENCDGRVDEDCVPDPTGTETTPTETAPGDTGDPESNTAVAGASSAGCGCHTAPAAGGLGASFLAFLLVLRRRALGRVVALFLGCVLAVSSEAATIPLDERDLIGLSEVVARATVLDVTSEPWGPLGVPVTRVDVVVQEVWKGQPARSLTFWQAGGTAPDGRQMRIEGHVPYRPGQEVILFLERSPSNVLVTAGGDLGALQIVGALCEPIPPPNSAAHPARPSQRPYAGWPVARVSAFVRGNVDAPWPDAVRRPDVGRPPSVPPVLTPLPVRAG